MGRLTTHVLDTAEGKPAAGLSIDVYRLDGAARSHLKTVTTNDDGRVDGPLLENADFTAGAYELSFDVKSYFGAETPAFYERIPVVFTVTNPDQHFHVPLLLSPFGYSTYRGS